MRHFIYKRGVQPYAWPYNSKAVWAYNAKIIALLVFINLLFKGFPLFSDLPETS